MARWRGGMRGDLRNWELERRRREKGETRAWKEVGLGRGGSGEDGLPCAQQGSTSNTGKRATLENQDQIASDGFRHQSLSEIPGRSHNLLKAPFHRIEESKLLNAGPWFSNQEPISFRVGQDISNWKSVSRLLPLALEQMRTLRSTRSRLCFFKNKNVGGN